MRLRWTIAAAASAWLAWTTINTEMPWLSANAASAMQSKASACGAKAPTAPLNYTLKDINNKSVSLSAFKGKVILLDFWATWCGPCKVEIPWFIEFQEKYGKQGLQVVGVSTDDTLEKLGPYVKQMKMTYPVLQGLGQDKMQDEYGPMFGLPVTLLISRDGRICLKHIGLGDKETFEREIKALL